MDREEVVLQTNLPILDQVLSPSRSREFLNGGHWRDGGFAVIYRGNSTLTAGEQVEIKDRLGRFPSPYLVFKVPKGSVTSGEATAEQQLRNELGMLTDPFIQHFAVACSGFQTDSSGRRGLLLELAEGYDLGEPEDVARLHGRDFVRIAYQLARVYQRFHDMGVSPKDVSSLVYSKEFDPDNPRPSAFPPRIILFDLAWSQRMRPEGEERHLDVWRDTLEYFKNLQTLFAQVPKFKLKPVQKLIDDIANYPSIAASFAEVAAYLDERCIENAGLELSFVDDIVNLPKQHVDAEKLALMRKDFVATLRKYNLTLDPKKYILGRDAYVTDGLLAADVPLGINPNTAHYVELYIGDIIEHFGLTTASQIRAHVSNPQFPKDDRQECLTPHPKGGTLLDALLSKLAAQGTITNA